MKDSVIIKSFPNGITLLLQQEAEMEQIFEELGHKFSEAKNFFGNASMALSIEGRMVTAAEEKHILEVIRDNSNVNIVCIVGKDGETNKTLIKALQHTEKKLLYSDEGQFYKGNLKNREVLEREEGIVVLGDVEPGSAVISSGGIIVLGGLYGEAYAGSFVAALEMEPERIKIGDFKYKPKSRQPKWRRRSKEQPQVARVKNDKIVFEPFTKDLLNSF